LKFSERSKNLVTDIKDYVSKFSEAKLEKFPILVIPFLSNGMYMGNTWGQTGWVNDDSREEIIYLFALDADLGKKTEKILHTLAHEMAHASVFWKVKNGKLPEQKVSHSLDFWNEFLVGDNSTLNYFKNHFSSEDKKLLEDATNLTGKLEKGTRNNYQDVYYPESNYFAYIEGETVNLSNSIEFNNYCQEKKSNLRPRRKRFEKGKKLPNEKKFLCY